MKTLVLIPTDLERRQLAERLADVLDASDGVELCGFGPVAAAARTAGLLATLQPRRVVLIGIAGAITAEAVVGEAASFSAVACDGIGAGQGAGFVPAGSMGWPQGPGDPPQPGKEIGDQLSCGLNADSVGPLLLTVCAASASAAEVSQRQRLFPSAIAEDMEGFGVAVACRMAGVPLGIVRGFSNRAGDRDVANWKITAAIEAAAACACQLLRGT